MTIEDTMIAKFDRDGWPLSLVRLINSLPDKPLHVIIREWMSSDAED